MKKQYKKSLNKVGVLSAKKSVAVAVLAATVGSAIGVSPAVASPGTNKLVVTVMTGSDDLRGGAVGTAQLRFANGRSEPVFNMNRGANWKNNSKHVVTIPLSRQYSLHELANSQLIISHDGAGRNIGESYDNWNIQTVVVRTPSICTGGQFLVNRSLNQRFTGSNKSLTMPVTIPRSLANARYSNLNLTILTGTDDLRGGATATAQVRLRDGRTLPAVNLNRGANWQNNSTHTVSLPLASWVSLGQIQSVVINHDGAGRNFGESYDNWNVSSVRVALPKKCAATTLGHATGNPWARLTGKQKTASIRLQVR